MSLVLFAAVAAAKKSLVVCTNENAASLGTCTVVLFEEEVSYNTFKGQLGNIVRSDFVTKLRMQLIRLPLKPLYATLGNHDSIPSGYATPADIRNDSVANAMAWNYELLSSLWQHEGWLDNKTASYASTNYGAYAVTTKQGLNIVNINTDFYYTPNVLNYFNYHNSDNSGILKFLIDELEALEKISQRV